MKKLINKTIILSLFVALTGCNDWLESGYESRGSVRY